MEEQRSPFDDELREMPMAFKPNPALAALTAFGMMQWGHSGGLAYTGRADRGKVDNRPNTHKRRKKRKEHRQARKKHRGRKK